MIEILDDIIPITNQNNIQKIVECVDFKWICVDTVNYPKEYNSLYKPNKKQFEHHLVKNYQIVSEYFEPIFDNLPLPEFNQYKILRAKVNLNIPNKRKNFITPHTDSFIPNSKSIIYYINNSDGETIIYNNKFSSNSIPKFWWNKTKISPKKGRIVKFNSNILHSGNVPYEFITRLVLNIVLVPHKFPYKKL